MTMSGMSSTTIQAPWVNLVTAMTTVTTPVTTAPMPLIARRQRQPGPRVGEPVPHHAGLRQRERDEDADRVERDQGVGLAAEEHDQERRRGRPG